MGTKKPFIVTLVIVSLLAIASIITYMSYEAYVVRTKTKEAFSLIEPAQREVERYVDEHNGIPLEDELNNKSFGLPQPFDMSGTYISNILVHKAANTNEVTIYAKIDNQLLPDLHGEKGNHVDQPYMRYIGTYNNGQMTWHCLSNLAKKYLPDNCTAIIE